METTRPPGFPGNPPARMPRAPTPARSPPPRPLRCGDDNLPSNARRRPSHSMHFGAQSRGLRAPCERFAPWVTPGPRITRFRLAADLGRMGLDTHRVSNKVSKITSRHLVPLDRAFPAHALVHDSKLTVNDPNPRGKSPTHTVRLWPTELGHLVQDVTRDHGLGHSPASGPGAKPFPENRFVPKERILHPAPGAGSRPPSSSGAGRASSRP